MDIHYTDVDEFIPKGRTRVVHCYIYTFSCVFKHCNFYIA